MDTFQSVADSRFDSSNGWTQVASSKRYRKQKRADHAANSGVSGMIFPNERSILAVLEDELVLVRRAANGAGAARSKLQSNCYRYNDEIAARDGNLKKEEEEEEEEEEKEKEKEMEKEKEKEMEKEKEKEMEMGEKEKEKEKEKEEKKKKQVKTAWWKVKEKESLAEGAAKIDFECLDITLRHISASYGRKPEWIRLLRFVRWFGLSLSNVQFSWPEMFKDPRLFKLIDVIDVPFSYIPQLIYKRTSDWINEQPLEALGRFVWWAFDLIMDSLAARGGPPYTSHISEVGIFVTLAMVLRSNPRSLYIQLPLTRSKGRHQGPHTLPVKVWMIAQASQGNLIVGLSTWGHNLLPEVGTNPHSRHLILQLVEKILSDPNARTKLLADGADRMDHGSTIPPSSFENLLRLTFPAPSARVKATARFEAIYPLLKEVALAGAPGSKTMKLVTRQMFTFSLKLAQEGNPVLAKEATEIAIWSVTENVDCCKLWDNLYEENLKGSVAVLKKLVDEWENHSLKLSSSPRDALTLKRTMKSFRLKNKKAITEGGASGSLYEEADKSCKVILGRLPRGSGFLITAAVLAALEFVLSFHAEGTTVLNKLQDSVPILKCNHHSFEEVREKYHRPFFFFCLGICGYILYMISVLFFGYCSLECTCET